jgi:ankyrin repeat protein
MHFRSPQKIDLGKRKSSLNCILAQNFNSFSIGVTSRTGKQMREIRYRKRILTKRLGSQFHSAASSQSGAGFGETRGSPLSAAAKFGSPEMVELLLDTGADVNASTWAENGETSQALFAANEVNNTEIVELLLAHGEESGFSAGDWHLRNN